MGNMSPALVAALALACAVVNCIVWYYLIRAAVRSGVRQANARCATWTGEPEGAWRSGTCPECASPLRFSVSPRAYLTTCHDCGEPIRVAPRTVTA